MELCRKTILLLIFSSFMSVGWGQDCIDGVEVELWGGCYNIYETTYLDLSNSGLTGEIPPEIGNLTNLFYLSLGFNQLTGEIPSEIGNLTSLTTLGLHYNSLTGEIPSSIGNLTNLVHLWLGDNQLSGEIPPEIGNLTNLTGLDLYYNQLTGEIPSEIGNLTNLTQLLLYNNQLTGEIPSEIGNLTNLTQLYSYNNQLTGEIPSEIGNLTNLTLLDLGDNQLTSIPESFGDLSSLEELSLYNNQLTTIPESIGDLESLWIIVLSNNQLYCEDGQQNEDLIPDFLTDGSINIVFGLYDQDCCNNGLEADCAGVCGGDAVFDECGVCGGDGSACGDFECDLAEVCVFIHNVDIDAGTLDIYMINQAGCSYCDDPLYNTQAQCESVGATWMFDASMSQSECCEAYPEDLIGVCADDGLAFDCPDGVCDAWFDGKVKGFEFRFVGMTITGVSDGTAEQYLDYVDFTSGFDGGSWDSKIMGISFGTSFIPAGSAVLTTVAFSDFGEGICFLDSNDNDCSLEGIEDGLCDHLISDSIGLSVNPDLGDCYCVIDADTDGVCDADDNCPAVVNPNQLDTDGDDIGDACDECPESELGANVDEYGCEYCNLGDMNGDDNYNVLDIVTLANCVLAGNCDDFENGCAADTNGDGTYNVLDIVILANCVLASDCGGL